ncbi:MAG: AAA family ATPase [Thaumarchaeota archaeon]|nr:AAA family ATPase [Nitrososphaerota archaeon]
MSVQAAKELEEAATNYAAEAIRHDSHGARGKAIQMYQMAIQTLLKLAHLYPDYKLNKLYMDRAMAYQERIKALQNAHGLLPPDEKASEEETESADTNAPSGPAMVEHLKASYNELVMQEKPNVKWDEVVGLDEAKNAIREAITFPVIRPDLFPLGWPRGVLLYGPPGCGKTMLAAATAAEIDGYFVDVDAASIMSKWLGEAEKNVAKLFQSTRKMLDKGAVIIFIDEIDSLLGSRSQEIGGEVRVRNQFLKEMDGIADKGKNIHLYVIGATNKPWTLDWPFLRRFQKRIYVPLPNPQARGEMLKLYTAPLKLDPDVDMEELAKITDGYSGSDVRDICQGVQLKVVRELFQSGKADDMESQPRLITLGDFKQVLESRKPSVSVEMLRAYANWSDNYKAL